MAARLNRWTPEIVRKRIQTAHIVTVLQKHIRGKLELSNTQVRAAEVLLRKTLPDQSSVTHSGQVEMVKADELSDSLLAYLATAGGTGITQETASQEEPSELH